MSSADLAKMSSVDLATASNRTARNGELCRSRLQAPLSRRRVLSLRTQARACDSGFVPRAGSSSTDVPAPRQGASSA
eukprot:6172461-Pleurochrysis_carterae.AAC.1